MSKVDDNILDLANEFNMWTEDPEQIKLKNPVLNGMFHGGLPKGSVIQIAAQSGVGKSTLVLQISKELCELGYKVAYIDVEKGLNPNMLKSTGVFPFTFNDKINPSGTFYIFKEYDCGKINTLIQRLSGKVDVIILDSLGALDSKIYADGGVDANNPKVGADTKSIKIIMKTINGQAIDTKTSFICINHLAQSIGGYIQTENPTGGRAPVYLSDIIIKLTKKSSEFEKMRAGQKVEYEAIKSRYGAGKAKVPFYIRFGQGIAMIPTYREVLETVIHNGKPVLEIRGGGNGSLHLNGEEYKFRGDAQLLNLIAEHYSTIKEIVPADIFEVKAPDLPDWTKVDTDLIDVETKLPEDLQSIPIVEKEQNIVYFDKGVDATGQSYYISYDTNLRSLAMDFDGQEETTYNACKEDYDDFKKKLQKYLKKCEKEMKN